MKGHSQDDGITYLEERTGVAGGLDSISRTLSHAFVAEPESGQFTKDISLRTMPPEHRNLRIEDPRNES